jgi:large subunit ribosomal protein L21
MYAIIEDGSRQYRAEEGQQLIIDYRDVNEGDTIELTKVLLVGCSVNGNKIGQPLVTGAKVITKVVGFPKTKTVAQSFRRRKASKRLRGHTQPFVRVEVTQIVTA